MIMQGLVYDIESAINLFYIHFYDLDSKVDIGFEFSERKWEKTKLGIFLRGNKKKYFIGFNNLKYDGPILVNFIKLLASSKTHIEILKDNFNLSNKIVNDNIKLDSGYFIQLDLAEIGGFNTKATHASLKQIEFNLKLENIENIPFNVKEPIPLSKLDTVIYYCKNDVFATKELYYDLIDNVKIRLDDTYDNILNLPNTRIGEAIIQQELGLNTLYIDRDEFDPIEIKDIIFDFIDFKIPVFKTLLSWFKTKTISKPAGFFNLIDFEDIKELEGYYNIEVKKGKLKNLNVLFKGVQYNLGAGGLHASRTGVFTSNLKKVIVDIDVNSYYPNISIEHKMVPFLVKKFLIRNGKDVSFFTEKYSGFKEKRKLYHKPHPLNLFYKLALNILYGKSLQPSSIFGDLEYGMKTTINGQLMLLMLIETLSTKILDLIVIQANTDGITIEIDREYQDLVFDIVKEWENLTSLQMEQTIYNKMVIADVNNYIAITDSGKIKRKGVFGYTKQELPHNKDYSQIVVKKALENYYLKGISYRKFIKEHDDIFDFCKRVRIDKRTSLIYRTNEESIPFEIEYGKVTRYLITKKGGKLIKIMPPLQSNIETREMLVEADYLVFPVQHINNNNSSNLFKIINYDYYIREVEKVIGKIEHKFLLKKFKTE